MQIYWIGFFLFLVGCAPPAYQYTTYPIEEFVTDSHQIAEGKRALLTLENKEVSDLFPEPCDRFEETMMEGDELSIVLHCPKRLDRSIAIEKINSTVGFRVCNGHICLPHLSSIEVEGLTLKEVEHKIQAAYWEQAQAFVNFKKKQERHVRIIGASKSMVTVDGQTRLFEVLAEAHIPSDANLLRSYVMRNGQQLPIDLYKLIHQGDASQNVLMQGGDQIFIAKGSDSTVMITGEVRKPMDIPIPYGFLPLREALAKAGGILYTGDKGCIQIIRGNLTRPKIYCLAWREMSLIPTQSLLLMPGDIVVVSERPITEWNRFISQLEPNIIGIQNATSFYQIIKNSH